jgi:hypothetical protein
MYETDFLLDRPAFQYLIFFFKTKDSKITDKKLQKMKMDDLKIIMTYAIF